jgi:hypothetical protein
MEDMFYAILALDHYTVVVAFCFVTVAFWLIREIMDSFMFAALTAPVLLVGALFANYIFGTYFIAPVNDKDTNVVIASAVGVVVALMLVLTAIWISVLMSERGSKRRRPLPALPPRDD